MVLLNTAEVASYSGALSPLIVAVSPLAAGIVSIIFSQKSLKKHLLSVERKTEKSTNQLDEKVDKFAESLTKLTHELKGEHERVLALESSDELFSVRMSDHCKKQQLPILNTVEELALQVNAIAEKLNVVTLSGESKHKSKLFHRQALTKMDQINLIFGESPILYRLTTTFFHKLINLVEDLYSKVGEFQSEIQLQSLWDEIYQELLARFDREVSSDFSVIFHREVAEFYQRMSKNLNAVLLDAVNYKQDRLYSTLLNSIEPLLGKFLKVQRSYLVKYAKEPGGRDGDS